MYTKKVLGEHTYIDEIVVPVIKTVSGCDWHRITQPLIHLGLSIKEMVLNGEKMSMELKAQHHAKFDFSPERYTLITSPLGQLQSTNLDVIKKTEEYLGSCSILLFNRTAGMAMEQLDMIRKKFGLKIVMDMDDYWQLNDDHAISKWWKDTNQEQIILDYLYFCDAIIVTTERLREKVLPHNPNCYVIPNCVDIMREVNDREFKTPTRFGYVGGSTHVIDIKTIEKVFKHHSDIDISLCGFDNPIRDLLEKEEAKWKNPIYRNLQIKNGWHFPQWNGITRASDQIIKCPWNKMESMVSNGGKNKNYHRVETKNLFTYMQHYDNIDVALAPLHACEWSSYKSSLKAYEAAAKGCALIAQRCAPFSDDLPEDVVTFCDTEQDWIEAIEKHKNLDYTIEMAAKLQEWVRENRSYDVINKVRLDVFKQIIDNPSHFLA